MITLYTWKTPNGYKVPILLEELGLEYEIKPVNIGVGEQKTPEYAAINPNNKIPALIDTEAEGGPLTIFESGAILVYLAEKAHATQFLPQDAKGKYAVLEWLFFQMASVGPMFGQAGYFIKFAKEKVPLAEERYRAEAVRLCGVMDTRLGAVEYLAGEYSIADIATWPWVKAGVETGYVELASYPNMKRWYEAVAARAAVQRALEKTNAATVV
jgi:GST-like protein